MTIPEEPFYFSITDYDSIFEKISYTKGLTFQFINMHAQSSITG